MGLANSSSARLLLGSLLAAAGCSGSSDVGSPGTLTVESSTLAFNALSPSLDPPPKTIRATVIGASGPVYMKVVATGPAIGLIQNARMTSATTGEADVYAGSAYALGPGVHTGTIQIFACTSGPDCASGQLDGSPQTIAVTYTVLGVAASISSASFTIGNAPAAADWARAFTVTAGPGQAWTTTSDADWLGLSAASGGGGTTPVTAALVSERVQAMPNGSYTAEVSILPVGLSPVHVPVTLVIARTQLNHVAPVIAVAGAPGDVHLSGENLEQVTVEGLAFGDVAATSFEVVSGTEIRATHPALAAGTYRVRLQTDLGEARSLSTALVVVDRPTYAPAALSYLPADSRWFTDVLYDAEREALLVAVQEGLTQKLLRYAYVEGAGWGAPDVKAIGGLSTLAWSPDGRRLLVGAGTWISQRDPVTLDELGTASACGWRPGGLAVTSDGNVLAWTGGDRAMSGLFWFCRSSLGTGTAELLVDGPMYSRAQMGASWDGTRVVAGGVDAHYGTPVYAYAASSGTFTPLGQRDHGQSVIALDRTGAHVVMGTNGLGYEVFDADLQPLGSLPATTLAAVPNPAGTRAYTYEPSGATATLRVFDLTQPPVAGALVELGTAVTLAANPDDQGSSVKLVISPDGGTLFLAGPDAVVVQPAPAR